MEVEGHRRQMGFPPEKYYGKWPFIRVYGMQEVSDMKSVFTGLFQQSDGAWQAVSASVSVPSTQSQVLPRQLQELMARVGEFGLT